MFIAFTCPSCGRKLQASDTTAGKQAMCKCGRAVLVPYTIVPTHPDRIPSLIVRPAEEILNALPADDEVFDVIPVEEPEEASTKQARRDVGPTLRAEVLRHDLQSAEDGYVRFLCPKCQKRLKAQPAEVDKLARCHKCGQRILVPAPRRDPKNNPLPHATALPEAASGSRPMGRTDPRSTAAPTTTPPRKPRRDSVVVWAGVAAINSTFLLVVGLMGLLQIRQMPLLLYVVCLVVAALIGGYFASAVADQAKFRQCFRAAFYVTILQMAFALPVIAHQVIELTKSKPTVNLTAAFAEVMFNIYTNWRVISGVLAFFGAFLVGGMIERVTMSMTHALSTPERWTFKTAAGQRIDTRGPWRHPLLASLWTLLSWLFILGCWTPLFVESALAYKTMGCAVFLVLGRLCRLMAKKRTARSARIALRDDPNPPIIYLRSFRDDGRKTREGSWRILIPGLFAMHIGTIEERLARILRRFGPFVAIGKPGEELPEMGAARMYVGDDDWQAVVSDLLNRPNTLAVLQAGETQGLRWELSRIGCDLKPEQVLIFLPFGKANNYRSAEQYRAFRAWAEECLPVKFPAQLKSSCFIYFTAPDRGLWQARVLRPREQIAPRHPLWPILERLLKQHEFYPKWFSLKGPLGLLLAFFALLLLCILSSGFEVAQADQSKWYLEKYKLVLNDSKQMQQMENQMQELVPMQKRVPVSRKTRARRLADEIERLPSRNVDPEVLAHTRKVVALLRRVSDFPDDAAVPGNPEAQSLADEIKTLEREEIQLFQKYGVDPNPYLP